MRSTIYITLFAALAFLTSCNSQRFASSSQEYDDVYYSSQDRANDRAEKAADRAEQAAMRAEQAANSANSGSDAARFNSANDRAVVNSNGQSYDDARMSKQNFREEYTYYDDPNFDPYRDDDFYYSRRMRRFNTPSARTWGYYDPYFAYDPYFVMGTSTWNAYRYDPWWYDPFFYNGPS